LVSRPTEGTIMQVKKGRGLLAILGIALLLGLAIVVWNLNREKPAGTLPPGPGTAVEDKENPTDSAHPIASTPVEEGEGGGPRPIELALVDKTVGGLGKKLTRAGSTGKIFLVAEDLTFSIQRDYDQRAAVEVENRSKEPQRIVADLIGLEEDMLGGFVGPGSVGHPLELAPGAKAVLALHLFAQDATRGSYHPRVEIKESESGQVLAWAPVSLLLPPPKFNLAVTVGAPEPGTLALPIIVTNGGGPLTDLAVTPGKSLDGKVFFQPNVSHANLPANGFLHFKVHPRLNTAFDQLEGEIVLRGAGRQQNVPVRFTLPPGKKVFVGTSFCTDSAHAADSYCVNRPNVDTSIGGFFGGPIPPSAADNPYRAQGDWTWVWGRIGPWTFHTTFGHGPPPGSSSPNGADRLGGTKVKLPPLGLGAAADPQTGMDPAVGNSAEQGNGMSQFSGGDEPPAGYPPSGGLLQGPRGLRVRHAYTFHRPLIFADNEPESMIAVSGGEPDQRVLLQVWHSEGSGGEKGRQIWLRVWDGHGWRPLSRPIPLTDGQAFDQWPTVLAFPDLRALVVWESAAARDGPPSLKYRVSAPGFGSWSPIIDLPGAKATDKVGSFDPVAVLGPDGRITLVWQQGEGKTARIMVTRSTGQGDFAAPVSPKGLPSGSSRPHPQVGQDGLLHLVVQAPVADEGLSAVFYARCGDGGRAVDSVKRLSSQQMDAGEADLLVDGQTLHAAFREGADWNSRIMHAISADNGETWNEPEVVTPDDQFAEYPSLSLRPGQRVGLTYYGQARGKPTRPTTLNRYAQDYEKQSWGAPRRLLTHFPTVVAAWLQVNFRLRHPREHYLPHELSILLDGQELLHQKQVIPEGTYVLPLDPNLLRVDENGLPRNVIGIRTRHMNSAHYSSATDFRLQARQAFLERLVVAKDQQEADALLAAETADRNHARPDVGLFAVPDKGGALLPATPKMGAMVTVPLLVGNLGEQAAGNVRIEVFTDAPDSKGHFQGRPVTKAVTVGELKPLESRTLDIVFPYTGKEHYYVMAQLDGDDFDSANNVHLVSFAVPKPPIIQPLESEQGWPLAIRTWDDADPPFLWRLLEAGTQREVARVERGQVAGKLPSGKYQLTLTRYQFEGQEVIFPKVIDYQEGTKQRLTLRTAIEIDVPQDAGPIFRWEIVRADNPEEIVQWHYGTHRVMLVPPGEYRLATLPVQFGGHRLVWPQRIRVKEDEHVVVRLASTIKLDMPKEAGPLHKWETVRTGQPMQIVQWHYGNQRMMLLPPGKYQIAVEPIQFGSERLVWPKEIEVKEDQQEVVRLASTIKLDMPKEAGPLRKWEIIRAGEPKETIQWQYGNERRMLVPPGKYQIAVEPIQFGSERLVWPKEIEVKQDQQEAFRLNSGIRIDLPKDSGRLHRWEAVVVGKPDQVVQWHGDKQRTMLLPPGEYQVAIQPTQFTSERLVWPKKVQVEEGFAGLELDSGIRLISPADTKPEFDFQFIDLERKKIVQRGSRTWAVQLLPAGNYGVEIRRDQSSPWQSLKERVLVEPGGFTEVKLPALPDK
jgi:hypothetical protein